VWVLGVCVFGRRAGTISHFPLLFLPLGGGGVVVVVVVVVVVGVGWLSLAVARGRMATMMTPEELEESGVWETEEPDNPTQIAHQRAIIARQQEELNEMRQEMETWRRQMIDVRRTMAEQGINLQVRRQVDESP